MKYKKLLLSIIISVFLSSSFTGHAWENAKEGKDLKIGDTFIFGSLEQDYDFKDDDCLLSLEPIEWIVIDKTKDKALLLSKYVLDADSFLSKREETTWEKSDIREYLNGTFKDTWFSESEKNAILKTTVENQSQRNREYNTEGGNDTEDYFFLLSYKEATRLFDKKGRITTATKLAEKLGAKDIFSKNALWWLRSPGKKQNQACYVMGDGDVYYNEVDENYIGIRPAFWLDLNADFSKFDYEYYKRAKEAFDSRNYEDVVENCDTLIYDKCGYQNALFLYYESLARLAMIYSDENDDYLSYLSNDFFEFPEDDTNYYELVCDISDTCYESAKDCMTLGDYKKAISILTYLGQYKDSMELLRECFGETHTNWRYLTHKIGSVVNTGKDTGYSKKNQITGNDPQLGWYLGRFWISGYTEERNESGKSTFIKTPGDNMILWFDLEQNINALNNDENLSIARDTNGYDQEFQIPKSDFGRGALFIRHINSQNEDTDPQEYKNYLVAHDDTGANAKVEIKEEGIYQVALDYEIAKKSKIAMANITDYYDYRISFSFEVRNGSGMFYLFDLTTESELQDYAVTNSGFRIDLANSHALSINFTRYGLNQTGTGLDVRKTEVASNGDRFDKTGYYEITVTNRETNEKLTKHVFIGSDGDLEEYKEADPSILSKF